MPTDRADASDGSTQRLLAFGTYDADRHPRVRVLLEGLSAHGAQVEQANVPLRLSTAQRVAMLRQPWRLVGLAARLAVCWTRLVGLAVRARRRGPVPTVLVGYLGHFDVVLARVLFPRARIVLDHLISAAGTATDRGVAGGARTTLLRSLDLLATACADLVVVDTAEHVEVLPVRAKRKAVVVAVGADASWFEAGDDVEAAEPHERLSVVFFGAMTPLQGAPVVAEALRLLDGAVSATVIGRGQDDVEVDARLTDVPQVRRLDWVEPARLPALVAAHDVCLGIFGTTHKARLVVPNKVYQGAAAGCAVVTSDTAPQRRALGDDALLVPPGDAQTLATVLRRLADDPDALAHARLTSRARAAERFRAQQVVAGLVARLRDVP